MVLNEQIGAKSQNLQYFYRYRRVIILMDVDVVKTADAVATKIGNPVQYGDGKKLFKDSGSVACSKDFNCSTFFSIVCFFQF